MTLALYGKSKQRQSMLLIAALVALVGSIASAMVALTPADADHVAPIIVTGTTDDANPTCAELAAVYGNGQTWAEFKIEPVANGTYPVGSGSITISGFETEGTASFDWTSTFGIDAVLVKQASANHNLYLYSEAMADTNLSPSGGQGGISHITFCYDLNPQLTVVKEVQDNTGAALDSPQDFAFTVAPNTGVSPSTFSLDDDANATLSNSQAVTIPATTDADDSYTITETIVAGFTLHSVSCVGATTAASVNGITVTVTNSSVATCTFVNRADAAVSLTRPLRVIKVANDNTHPAGSFSGTITPGGESAADDAFSLSLAENALTSPPDVNTVSLDAQSVVEAAPPPNWELTGYFVVLDAQGTYVCTGAETYAAGPAVVPAGELGYTVCIKNTFTAPAPANPIIQLCKDWNTGQDGIINADRDFLVDVSDTSETELVTIPDVTEGGATECILLSVSPGLVTFTETVPTGFLTPTWTVTPESAGVGNEVTVLVSASSCSVGQVAAIQPLVVVVTEGTPICTVTFINVDTGAVAADGGLVIQKFLDLTGDGDANDPGEGPLEGWTFTTTGGAIPPANQVRQTNAAGQITEYQVGFAAGTILNVTETQQAGFILTDVELDGLSVGTNLSNNVTIQSGQVRVIRYFNQPNREIRVVKVAVTRHNQGPDVAAPNDDDGWSITVSSVQCQFSQTMQTDANGVAVFTNLPLCNDYVVSENPLNPNSPGFQPVSAVQFTGQTPGVIGNPLAVTFVNRLQTSDTPPTQTPVPPTATPVIPTATPTNPTATPANPTATPTGPTATPTNTVRPNTPTNTPVPPTNTPVSVVQGERTTPVAPSAGDGLATETTSGMNFLLIAGGLLAVSLGLTALAFSSRRK